MSVGMKLWLARLLIVAAALVAYSNIFDARFVLDDGTGIMVNPTIRKVWPPAFTFPQSMRTATVAGRPLVNFTFSIDYAIGGLDPRQYHATNLAIHICAGLALFGLLRRTFGSPKVTLKYGSAATGLSLAATLLWVAHPLTTQAVTYAVQRAESLMALLFVLALLCLARSAGAKRPAFWLAASAAFCLLGAGAKEVMAVCPIAALLYDRAFIAGSFREALRRRRWYYGCLTATWAVTAALLYSTGMHGGTVGGALPLSSWDYLAVESWAILRYLKLAVWPSDLTFDYGGMTWLLGDPILYLSMIAVAALVSAAIWKGLKTSRSGYAPMVFFLLLAPTSSLVPILDPVAEHRMYLPLAAFLAFAVVCAWEGVSSLPLAWRKAAVALVGIAVCGLAFATNGRNKVYHSELDLWRDTIAKSPRNQRAAMETANALKVRGDQSGALEWYRKAVELDPENDVNRFNLGSALIAAGNVVEAAGEFRKALELDPEYFEARFSLGLALMKSGRPAEAVGHFSRLMNTSGFDPKIQYNLGLSLAASGRLDEGISHVSEAARRGGYPPPAVETLADLLVAAGRNGEAVKWYDYVADEAVKSGEFEAAKRVGAKMAAVGKAR